MKWNIATIIGFIIGVIFCIVPMLLVVVGRIIHIFNKSMGDIIMTLAMSQIQIVADFEDNYEL